VTAYKWFLEPLPLGGFVEVSGLPICVLKSSGEYPAFLGRRKRKNLLKKIEKNSTLAFVEYAPGHPLPEELIGDVQALYEKTAARANLHFERLTTEYFRLTAAISTYLLAYEGDRPIGFAQWLRKENRMAGKYIGMDYARSGAYEIYFGLAIQAIQNGIRDGVTEFELGVLSYYSKRLLGAELVPTRLYFRHRNALVHRVLEKCRFLLEPSAEELK
jgi:predicted N-acyltransferase